MVHTKYNFRQLNTVGLHLYMDSAILERKDDIMSKGKVKNCFFVYISLY
jgi:hypothetical protein